MIIIAFLVCWTPYTIIYLWPVFAKKRIGSTGFIGIGWLLAKFSTVATPLILTVCDDDAKKKKSD
jgi:hypothetical protein